jgi:hypothetical protein
MSESPLSRPAKKASKSKAAKRDRAPHEPAELKAPNPRDYFASAAYIDQRAAMGDFKGAGAAVLPVLHYLWRHQVRGAAAKPGLGRDERSDEVLTGKSRIARIAAELNLSYSAVQRAVTQLVNAGWLTWYGYRDDQTMILQVRMDGAGHRDRESLRETGVSCETTPPISEATPAEGGVGCETTPGGLSDHTLLADSPHPVSCETTQGRDFDLDFDLDLNHDARDEKPTQSRTQNPPGESGPGNPPSDDPRSDDELRSAFLAVMEHHRTPETAIRPSAVWDLVGGPVTRSLRSYAVVQSILDDGLFLPADRGWYLPTA